MMNLEKIEAKALKEFKFSIKQEENIEDKNTIIKLLVKAEQIALSLIPKDTVSILELALEHPEFAEKKMFINKLSEGSFITPAGLIRDNFVEFISGYLRVFLEEETKKQKKGNKNEKK